MQEDDIHIPSSEGKIECIIAAFRNFSSENLIKNAVIYYCESHNDNDYSDREKHQATIELVHKVFDLHTCEKYEIRSGYLNRYNYLSKPIAESFPEEIEEAIIKAKQVQNEWLKRVEPALPEFKTKDWRECIFREYNVYFEGCKKLVLDKIQKNGELAVSVSKTVNEYVDKHNTNIINANAYVVEELSWILSLPLLHLNKPIYLIHVGSVGDALRALFAYFPDLQKAVKWLIPKINTVIFENEYDFLMNYRNAVRVGYSYAMKNKDIVRAINIYKKESNPTKEELTVAMSKAVNENDMLLSLIEKLPCHVYWLNRDNVCLGCNDLQAKRLGFKTRYDVIGKASNQLYPPEDADIIEKNNIRVMETGIPYEGEEKSVEGVCYLSKKTPLYDTHEKVIGLLGISIDITDRKKAEELEEKNKLQQIEIESQRKITKLAEETSHDLRTPLSILSVFTKTCEGLSEKNYSTLRSIIESIRNIAYRLLPEKYNDKKEVEERLADPIEQYCLVSHNLEEIIEHKKYEYKDSNVTFNLIKEHNNPNDPFLFVKGDFVNYGRMMSNLINNAVESHKDNPAVIDVGFRLEGRIVEIFVKDRGKGMPQRIIDRIMSDIPVTTKETGYGIGLRQIRKAIRQMKGMMRISSKENEGTTFLLAFPRSETPKWFTEKIILPKGGLIVVLDDDPVILDYWEHRLKSYKNDITIKYFTKGNEAIDFINSFKEKDKIFLLTDYELRNQDINGVDVIEQCHLKHRSVLVTNRYTAAIPNFPRRAEEYLLYLWKPTLDYVPVTVEEVKSINISEVDIVIVDDAQCVADSLADCFIEKGKIVDTYSCPYHLLENLSKYRKNVKIVIDNEFKGSDINGIELSKRLHESGFSNLYLLSGKEFDENQVPPYLRIILKGSDSFDDLF